MTRRAIVRARRPWQWVTTHRRWMPATSGSVPTEPGRSNSSIPPGSIGGRTSGRRSDRVPFSRTAPWRSTVTGSSASTHRPTSNTCSSAQISGSTCTARRWMAAPPLLLPLTRCNLSAQGGRLGRSGSIVKVVILAGGLGTRLSEETAARPKPMVEIGERPILWHIMKTYSHYGFSDFIVCLGYKGYVIKEYFSNYFLHMSDVTFDMRDNSMEIHQHAAEPWRVTLVDTGTETQTGGRIRRVREHIGDETFMLTY